MASNDNRLGVLQFAVSICFKSGDDVLSPRRNVNLAIIKQALGHKSIASTAVYTVPTDQSAGKVVTAALASMF